MSSPEVLPCPFCGDVPTDIVENRYNLRMDGSSELLSGELRHHCAGPADRTIYRHYINIKGPTKDKAIEYWNRRYEQP